MAGRPEMVQSSSFATNRLSDGQLFPTFFVKVPVIGCRQIAKNGLKFLALKGEFLSFWRNGLVMGAILAIFSDFNLFKLGEFRMVLVLCIAAPCRSLKTCNSKIYQFQHEYLQDNCLCIFRFEPLLFETRFS